MFKTGFGGPGLAGLKVALKTPLPAAAGLGPRARPRCVWRRAPTRRRGGSLDFGRVARCAAALLTKLRLGNEKCEFAKRSKYAKQFPARLHAQPSAAPKNREEQQTRKQRQLNMNQKVCRPQGGKTLDDGMFSSD